jgi:hypothetical protein
VKKYYPTTTSSIGYSIIDIIYSGICASQRWRTRMTLRTRYKKVVGDYRDVKYFLLK